MTKRKTYLLATGALIAMIMAAPSTNAQAQPAEPPASLADLLIAASAGGELDRNPRDYDIILQTVIALEALGGDPDLGGATLLDVLSNPVAEVTVFVPTDGAFRKLARDLGWNGKGGDAGALTTITGAFDLATVRDVVKYHVVGEALNIFQVLRQDTFDTALPGASFSRVGKFKLADNDPDLKNPRLRSPAQLTAGESVAHTISRVLVPIDL